MEKKTLAYQTTEVRFLCPKQGGAYYIQLFSSNCCYKNCQIPSPTPQKNIYLPIYLILNSLFNILKKNNIAFISVYTSDITVFLQYCRLCLFYNVIFIYLHCFTCLHSVLHNMPTCHIIMSIYLYRPHNMSTYHPPPVQLVQPN